MNIVLGLIYLALVVTAVLWGRRVMRRRAEERIWEDDETGTPSQDPGFMSQAGNMFRGDGF